MAASFSFVRPTINLGSARFAEHEKHETMKIELYAKYNGAGQLGLALP